MAPLNQLAPKVTIGGDEFNHIHEKGLFIKGAWIESDLDFEGAEIYQSLGLINCHINKVIFRYCSIKGFIGFQGCFTEGIEGDSLKCAGDVFINEGFISSGTVRFCDAQIDGSLDCQNATLFGDCIENDFSKTMSLICENAIIGNVLLNNGFSAYGTVNLVGTQIKGNLICDEGKFDHNFGISLTCMNAVIKGNVSFAMGFEAHGQVCLSGAQIGSLNFHKAKLNRSTDGYALRAENMDVKGIFAFRELQVLKGYISLMGSRVVLMEDDLDSWPQNNLLLDGFEYRKLAGSAPTSAAQRLIWVNKQIFDHLGLTNKGADFRPQPWVQLQKVLLEMGHYEDAKQVGIAFEDHRNKNKLIYRDAVWIYQKVSVILHKIYGLLIDYGYRPIKLLLISFLIFIICGGFYFYAAYQDVFAPSNPLVFQNGDYDVCKSDNKKAIFEIEKAELAKNSCVEPPPIQGAGNWYLCSKLRAEYTGFSPFAYSLDMILPLIDLQQEKDWAPMIPTPNDSLIRELFAIDLKHITRLVVWFEILYGWIASLLMVAVVSGLTKSKMG